MKTWLLLLLLPSLTFAERPSSINNRKDPIWVEVQSQQLVIYPEAKSIAAYELDAPDNDFEDFLGQVEQVSQTRYIILLLSPDSASLQRRLRALIHQHGIDLGLEPRSPGTKIDPIKMYKYYIPLMPERFLSRSTPWENRVWHEWQAQRGDCEVVVYSNSVVFLTNNFVLSREELQTPGNYFDQMLDRWKAGDYFPDIFCKEPGSEDLYGLIMDKIYICGAKMNEWTMAGTAIEVPPNGRTPVYLECRSNQLFAISADAPAQEFEISNLQSLEPATQFICFLVRPDSFDVFRKARKEAWEQGLDISCELQDASGPFAIGIEGKPPFPP